jgi:aryl-alcohol dehydrogenase-like predicted oxidoreductase
MDRKGESRRAALKLISGGAAAIGAQLLMPKIERVSAAPSKTAAIPRRKFGKTGVEVSVLGLGGYHLGSVKDEAEATKIVHASIDAGINFFDNAWEYNEGKSEDWMGKALVGKRDKVFLMTKVCTHGRGKDVAMKQLEESLKRLKTDHLDLWQVHEVVYDNDPANHYAKDGVLEALTQAKKQGKVRFVGFTGHKHPDLHLDMLNRGYAFDTIQMPLNAFDWHFRSFTDKVLPKANEKGLGVIGMKPLCGGGDPVKKGVLKVEEALRYAMSLPVSVTITGIDSYAILEQNLAIVRGFQPMSEAEMKAIREKVKGQAGDGRFELYKTSMKFEGKPGREQHGFPPPDQLGG